METTTTTIKYIIQYRFSGCQPDNKWNTLNWGSCPYGTVPFNVVLADTAIFDTMNDACATANHEIYQEAETRICLHPLYSSDMTDIMPTEPATNVILYNIHHGSKEQGREHFIYASLKNAATGELMIAASLDYIMDAIKTRCYVLVL